jgi:hypothetical protein
VVADVLLRALARRRAGDYSGFPRNYHGLHPCPVAGETT